MHWRAIFFINQNKKDTEDDKQDISFALLSGGDLDCKNSKRIKVSQQKKLLLKYAV